MLISNLPGKLDGWKFLKRYSVQVQLRNFLNVSNGTWITSVFHIVCPLMTLFSQINVPVLVHNMDMFHVNGRVTIFE